MLSVVLHCLYSVLKNLNGMVAADRLVSFGTHKLKWLKYRRAIFGWNLVMEKVLVLFCETNKCPVFMWLV